MVQNNGDFTAKECRVVMKIIFLKGNMAQKMYNDISFHKLISALPSPHSRTGLLGLEQYIFGH
jgi:hypothetical protein